MTKYLKRSRVTKALTDAGLVVSFDAAEARLDAVRVAVRVGADQARTPAGQAAALTAVVTAYKCFGRVSLVIDGGDRHLFVPLPVGRTLVKASRHLGAAVVRTLPAETTHLVQIGAGRAWTGWWVQCWWDRWLAGTRAEGPAGLGDSRLALAGIFAGALAIRQVFASVRLGPKARASNLTVSVWEPWTEVDLEARGPVKFTVPNILWFVGLGHLGQAYVWNFAMLPLRQPRCAVLQDDQRIGEENEATSLLVTAKVIGHRKTRVASGWLEACGWETEIIERRHQGDVAVAGDDPPFLLSGLDSLPPRVALVGVGFDYMVDVGIGRGRGDFEGIQLRVIPKGTSAEGLWNASPEQASKDRLLSGEAYRALESEIGACGTFTIADASVAVPFVGAAAGALAVAQLIRLASMKPATAMLQLELGAPGMVIDGGQTAAPEVYIGGEIMDLEAASASVARRG